MHGEIHLHEAGGVGAHGPCCRGGTHSYECMSVGGGRGGGRCMECITCMRKGTRAVHACAEITWPASLDPPPLLNTNACDSHAEWMAAVACLDPPPHSQDLPINVPLLPDRAARERRSGHFPPNDIPLSMPCCLQTGLQEKVTFIQFGKALAGEALYSGLVRLPAATLVVLPLMAMAVLFHQVLHTCETREIQRGRCVMSALSPLG